MSNKGKVIAVNLSAAKGEPKLSVPEIMIDQRGVVFDAHAGAWHRQVSLLCKENIDEFITRTKKPIKYGDFGENVTISGLNFLHFSVLDRIQIGDVILEITKVGKECHGDKCAIFREVGQCIMPQVGTFCRVIHGGKIKPEDEVIYSERPLQVLIITLSDRAFAQEYQDKSGAIAREMLNKFFSGKRWHVQLRSVLMPDDAIQLQQQLERAAKQNVDIVFTLGGTGVGIRDITPDVVTQFCDKIVSGVMENIRLKYGAQNPAALLSRSVFGTKQKMQIYALPGSVKAVQEYLEEILKTLEHVIFMLHSIDIHAKHT
jgi:molybdenum cofactor synthesis domain-containing protein